MSGLWDWTLEAYAQLDAPEACLDLQDAHGQVTAFLLWAVWAETADPALLARGAEITRRWDALAISPIRAVRRALKPSVPDVPDGARESLREDVKAAELHAERVLMEALAAITPRQGGVHALDALKAASAAWGPAAPDGALARLAAALA